MNKQTKAPKRKARELGKGEVTSLEGGKGFSWESDQALEDAWQRYEDREPFSYDLDKDPFYQQYAETYSQLGKLAMEDTVGVAAGMTGGYANSYGLTAGQQVYDSYLQQLQAVLPELYGDAYERYRDEGEALYAEAVRLQQQRDRAYDDFLREQEWEEDRRQDNYDRLLVLVEKGYVPTDEELAAAGMSRDQVNVLLNSDKGGSTGGGGNRNSGGLTAQQITQLQKAINENTGANIAVDGIWGNQSSSAVGGLSAEEAWEAYQSGTLFPQKKRNWADVENDLKALEEEGAPVKTKNRVLEEALQSGAITVSQYNQLYLKYCLE